MFWSRGSAAYVVAMKPAEKSLVKLTEPVSLGPWKTPCPAATVSGVVIHPAGVRELSARCSEPFFAPGSGRIEAKNTCSPSPNPYAPKMKLLSSLTPGVTSSYARQSGRFAEDPKRSAAFGHASSAFALAGASTASASVVSRSAASAVPTVGDRLRRLIEPSPLEIGEDERPSVVLSDNAPRGHGDPPPNGHGDEKTAAREYWRQPQSRTTWEACSPCPRETIPPRGRRQDGANAPDEGLYGLAEKLKRERERERCDSAKLAHLATPPLWGVCTSDTYVPLELTRKPTPSSKRPGPLSQGSPDCARAGQQSQGPNPILCMPATHDWAPDQNNITAHSQIAKPPTANFQRTRGQRPR